MVPAPDLPDLVLTCKRHQNWCKKLESLLLPTLFVGLAELKAKAAKQFLVCGNPQEQKNSS